MIDDLWWWSTPQWRSYAQALNRGGLTPINFGPHGNLVLRLDDGMKSRVRKGHWAHIAKTRRDTSIFIAEDGDCMDVMQDLHRRDAGRITRPQATWDHMRRWCDEGNGLLVLALVKNMAVGAAMFIRYGVGAYYASAARLPEVPPKDSPAHLIVWSAAEWLRAHGYRWLDLGPLDESTEKLAAICHFKRGFGTELRTWPYE